MSGKLKYSDSLKPNSSKAIDRITTNKGLDLYNDIVRFQGCHTVGQITILIIK